MLTIDTNYYNLGLKYTLDFLYKSCGFLGIRGNKYYAGGIRCVFDIS